MKAKKGKHTRRSSQVAFDRRVGVSTHRMESHVNGMPDSPLRAKSLDRPDASVNGAAGASDDEDEIDDHSAHIVELNNRIKNDFMSYCLSFVQADDEARECVQVVWNKYLQCVGDVSMISAFFDTLPYNVKSSVFPKYHNEIVEWCRDVLRISCSTLAYSMHLAESYSRVIRHVLKHSSQSTETAGRRAIIYVAADFDNRLKRDLLTSITNIKFEVVRSDVLYEDRLDCDQLRAAIQRDAMDKQSFPLMVIATAGTVVLGRCDELTKLKQLCDQHHVWLHVTGDLLGSLALLPTVKDNVSISCDSLTMDTIKLFGIQNLPYLTFFLRPLPTLGLNQLDETNAASSEATSSDSSSTASSTASESNPPTSDPFHELTLQSPSSGFLSIWSISQRCSKANVLYHMQRSLDLSTALLKRLKPMEAFRVLNDDDDKHQATRTYKRICSGDAPDEALPKTIVLFRFETWDVPEIDKLDDVYGYVELLNLWLFDKLSLQYPKMNLELVKSVHFQTTLASDHQVHSTGAHAIRFAPLEHLLDSIDDGEMQAFADDMQRYSDILLATMTARARLPSGVAQFENLVSIPMPQWAGIGAVRYIPSQDSAEIPSHMINTIQAELARKLQSNDSAFSLGGGTDEHDSMFYLRLGMIRKRDDLDILLQKIAVGGKETETALKYVEDMAEKIKLGIDQVQKDLQNENQQMLAQEGLLRQLPVISNIMSWWSPSPASSPLATKGRSFDLNSGRVESTEDTYAYRMQIKKQSPHAPTHNEEPPPTDKPLEDDNNQ